MITPRNLALVLAASSLVGLACFHDGGGLTAATSGPTTGESEGATATASDATSAATTAATSSDATSTDSSTSASTSSTSTSSDSTTAASTTDPITEPTSTTTTAATTDVPPELPPCPFTDDFDDAALSSGRWFVDAVSPVFLEGLAILELQDGMIYTGIRQKVLLDDIVECVTTVELETIQAGDGEVVLTLELIGNESDPGSDGDNIGITYAGATKSTTAAVRVAGVATALTPSTISGEPSALRIIRQGGMITPGVRIGDEWWDFDPTPMPDYGAEFRVTKLAFYNAVGANVRFNDLNVP